MRIVVGSVAYLCEYGGGYYNEEDHSGPYALNSAGAMVLAGAGLSVAASYADKSGTIAAGGTAQTLAAANTSRRGFWVQNNSTGDLWINTLATAIVGQPSLVITSGSLYESPVNGCPTGLISIIGATTGQAFTAREY